MTGVVFIYVTHPDALAALALGRELVESGLAACANVLPGMTTVYRWQGRTETGSEAVMILKTRAGLVGDVEARIKVAHPYECPCIAALPVTDGSSDYVDWILQSCRSQP